MALVAQRYQIALCYMYSVPEAEQGGSKEASND